MSMEAWEQYRHEFVPMADVPAVGAQWIIPNLIQPGLTMIIGPPKTFKSRFALHLCAAIADGKAVGPEWPAPSSRGSAIYFAAEQSPSRLRFIYERQVLKRKLPETHSRLGLLLARDSWEWKIDDSLGRLEDLIGDLKPTLLILDPLIHFHAQDENDPHLVNHLIPLKKAVHQYGGGVVIVHHARKAGNRPADANVQVWDEVRGTSALWAACDGGVSLKLVRGGTHVHVQTNFKDHEPKEYVWKP